MEQGAGKAGEGMKYLTEEHKRKIGEANKGRPCKLKGVPRSEETKRKISEITKGRISPMKGKKFTEEHKQKIAKAHIGKPSNTVYTPELRAKLSAVQKSRVRTPRDEETKRKLSEALKGRLMHPFPEETRKKISIALTGKIVKPETREKISEFHKGRKATHETKVKRSCALRGIPIEEFDGFVTPNNYCNKFNNPFKERVREFFGRVCVECGKTEKENKTRLAVHHVNYHKDACCNENVKLLFVSLCASCHAKTHYKRQYWEDYFTKKINEQYGGRCYIPKPTNS